MLRSNQAEFLAIYGRRRVGKTYLIRQFFKEQIVFEISGAKDEGRAQQIENFFGEYLKRTKGQRETSVPKTWQKAFSHLADYLHGLPPTTSKHVVFIDEMPWLDTVKSGFVSALEFFWNQHVSKMEHVILIACGSASSWIRKNLILSRGGLYNRVTQRLKLMPFDLHESSLFLQSLGIKLTQYQVLELYMVMGGIPFYLKEIEKGKSATQVIDELCFSPQGLLYDEYLQLYHALFKNAAPHVTIIEALAAQPQGMTQTDLTNKTKLAASTLSRTLEELEECDFIALYPPFLNRKKDGIYKLTDPYSLFYIKFVQPHKGSSGGRVWEQLSKQGTHAAWSGYAFENICMMHIQQIKSALGISGVYTNHSAWNFKGNDTLPGTQIDMVIDRADQVIHLCEAKFTREGFAVNNAYAAQLRQRKAIFKQATLTNKAVFTTLLSTYPALQNKYYLEEIENEVTMDKLFEPATF